MSVYRIVRGSLQIPLAAQSVDRSKFLRQGDVLPEGMYSDADIAAYLADGRIEEGLASGRFAEQEVQAIEARGKWTVDPAILEGKSLEDLRILINEIDENVDASTVETVEIGVQFLSQNWRGESLPNVPAASDRSRPEAMAMNLTQKGGRPAVQTGSIAPSKTASSALEAARAKAQAPSSDD